MRVDQDLQTYLIRIWDLGGSLGRISNHMRSVGSCSASFAFIIILGFRKGEVGRRFIDGTKETKSSDARDCRKGGGGASSSMYA